MIPLILHDKWSIQMIDLFSKIKEVTELDGIAGYEHTVRDYLRAKITPLVDEWRLMDLAAYLG